MVNFGQETAPNDFFKRETTFKFTSKESDDECAKLQPNYPNASLKTKSL